MHKLQFRIRPEMSLLDLEPKRFETIMAAIENIDAYRIYDDVVSDATFITIVVCWENIPTKEIFITLRDTLLRVEHVKVLVVDKKGKEKPLIDLDSEGQRALIY